MGQMRSAITRPDAPGHRVLVVDDEPTITELLSTALRYMGYDVTTAASGFAALDAAAMRAPDLVVLDVMLPDIDGFEVRRRLRDSRDFVPVIFLTARDAEEDRVAGFIRGGDDYVTKPFSLEELTLRIGALLRRTKGAGDGATSRLRYRDLEMDEDRHQVWRGGEIAASVVGAHGGEVRHEPTPGGGATFIVTLPLSESAGGGSGLDDRRPPADRAIRLESQDRARERGVTLGLDGEGVRHA